MNKNFLYILPFADNKHFKIGISSNNFSRLKILNKLYQIDFTKSYIVYSKVSNIKILERELLEIFDTDDCDKFYTDGHTEIRNVKYLNECVELIKNKHSNLKYDLQQFDVNIFDKVKVNRKSQIYHKFDSSSYINNKIDFKYLIQTDIDLIKHNDYVRINKRKPNALQSLEYVKREDKKINKMIQKMSHIISI
jgi:hypothetical protein